MLEDNNAGLGIPLHDLSGRLDSSQARHDYVHNDDVRTFRFGQLHCLPTISRFSHYFELLQLLQLHAKAFADDAVIIG
jgi:hypothetical protein